MSNLERLKKLRDKYRDSEATSYIRDNGVLRPDMKELYMSYTAPGKAKEIEQELKNIQNTLNTNYDSYQKRFFDAEGNYLNQYRGDSQEAYDDIIEQRKTLSKKRNAINESLEFYKDYIDPKYASEIKNYLDTANKDFSKLSSSYKQDNDHWSQWESKEAYDAAVQAYETEQKQLKEDLPTLKNELDSLQSDLNEAEKVQDALDAYKNANVYGTSEQKKFEEKLTGILQKYGYTTLEEFKGAVTEKRRYYNTANRLQNGVKMSEVSNPESIHYDPEFERYALEGGELSHDERVFIFGKYTGENEIAFWRETNQTNADSYELDEDEKARVETLGPDTKVLALNMTDQEYKTYNYWLAKEKNGTAEKGAAKDYLDSIQNTVMARASGRLMETVEDDTAFELLVLSPTIGLDNFRQGWKSAFSDEDYIPPSFYQTLAPEVRKDLADDGENVEILGSSLGQVAYDAINTFYNMAPSLAVGLAPVVGPYLSAASMGTSAYGNAYQEKLNLGYSKDSARTYATLVGGSEAGLSLLFGGISKMGGKLTNNAISKLLSKIDKAYGRFALNLGGKIASEYLEEFTQEILPVYFENVAFNAGNTVDDIDWENAAYSGLMGALMAFGLEGPGVAKKHISVSKDGKMVKSAGQVDALVKLGKSLDTDTVAYRLAGKVNEKTGAYTIGRLLHEAGASSLNQTNVNDIVSTLEKRGVMPSDAQTIVKYIEKAVKGEKLSPRQQMALDLDTDVGMIVQDILINQHSTVNQRIQGFNEIVKNTEANALLDAIDKKNAKAFKKEAKKSTEEIVKEAESNLTEDEKKVLQSKYETSVEGKTINKKTGDAVTVSSVNSIKDGEMTLRLDNGDVVNAGDVAFSSEGEALIYSTLADMNIEAAIANSLLETYKSGNKVSARNYALGIKEAYKYGMYSIPFNEISTHGFAAALTKEQRTHAYNLGKAKAKSMREERMAKIKSNAKTETEGKKQGRIVYETETREFTEIEKESISWMEKLCEALDIDIYVYESVVKDGKRVYKNKDGEWVKAPNGYYDPHDGTIHIDLKAGLNTKGKNSTMLFTVAHELTHFIKDWSPEKFNTLAEFLMQQYGEHGVSVDALVKAQIRKAKNNGREIDYDTAYEEVVADSMSAMLSDGKIIEKIALLNAKDSEIVEQMESFFSKAIDRLNSLYRNLLPGSFEGQRVKKMRNEFEKFQSLFADALVDASKNYNNAEVKSVSKSEVKYDSKNTLEEYTETQYNNFGWVRYNDVLTPAEYTTLLSRYADFKHNKNKFPVTKWGEAVIYSSDFPNVIMYVKGPIRSPKITKIVKIDKTDVTDISIIREEIILNEYERQLLPYSFVEEYYGQKTLVIDKARDYAPYRKIKSGTEGTSSEKSSAVSGENQDGTRGDKQGARSRTADGNQKLKLEDRDNLGNELSEGQTEYFADSKMRDDNGNLMVMYQGSAEEFFEFDRKKSSPFNLYGRGFYFTNSKSHASQYGNVTREYYLNIKNPISTYKDDNIITKKQLRKYLEVVAENEDYSIENYGTYDIDTILNSVYSKNKSDYAMIQDISATAIGDLVEAIELFNKVNGTSFDGLILNTETIVFNSEQAKLTTNKNPTENKDIRFDDRDARYQELQTEYNQLEKEAEALKQSEEYLNFLDSISILQGEELDKAVKEYGDWTRKSGLYDKSKRMSEIIGEQKDIRAAIDNERELSRDEYMKSIENLTEKEKMDFVNKAVERYGITNKIKCASYLMLNGEMLDFSEGQGYRVQDHREISEILDMPESAGYSDGLISFMNMGNIRMQTYGIDISKTPNPAQKSVLRDIISQIMRNEGEFNVDFSKTNGYTDGSVTYPKGTATSKILSDIDSYFETGVVPEYESSIAEYRYSERVTDEETLDFLNEQIKKGEYIKVYRSFQVIDGGLYAPMNAVDRDENGKNKRLGYRSEYGVWEKSTESPEIAQRYMDNHPEAPYAKFDLDGVDNKTNAVAYNPYLHASNLVLNDQFAAAYRRNLITVECYVPLSEADGTYKAQYAKDATGWVDWKAGGVAGKLLKLKPEYTRKLFVSRYMLPVRQVPDSEVATMYKEYLNGTDIAVPWNVVTPSLRKELEKAGVNISYEDAKAGSKTIRFNDVFSDDVKFSDRDSEIRYDSRDNESIAAYEEVNKQLRKENAQLKKDVEYVKELVKLQKQLTHGKVFSPKSLELVAKRLMTYNSAKGDVSELVTHLNKAYSHIISGEDVSWESIKEASQDAIEWLRLHESRKQVRDEYATDVLNYLRKSHISLSETQKKEVAYLYGSYNNFRKKNMGRFILTDKGVPLDSLWQELSELYPGTFESTVNEGDQPIELKNIIEDMQNFYVSEDYYYSDEMVNQDLLTKIYDNYWNVSTLHTVADAKQKEINLLKAKHRQQIDSVRDSHSEKVETLKKEHREKVSELRREYKERELKKLRKKSEEYQESRHKAVEGREKTVMRHKIKNIVNSLNRLLNNETKERNVKAGLKNTVEKALDFAEVLFTTNITNDEIVRNGVEFATEADRRLIEEYAELLKNRDYYISQIQELSEEKGLDVAEPIEKMYGLIDKVDSRMRYLSNKLSKVFEIERARLSKATMADAIKSLVEAYEGTKNSKDEYIKNAYTDFVTVRLKALAEDSGTTLIKDMSIGQLQEVYDAFKLVKHTIDTANDLFYDNKRENLSKTVDTVQSEIMALEKSNKKDAVKALAQIKNTLDEALWNELKPNVAFQRLGSGALSKLYWEVVEAQRKYSKDISEAKEHLEKLVNEFGYDKWDTKTAKTFKLADGREFKLTLEDMMSIYAYSRREQAIEHMTIGGFVFDKNSAYKEKGIFKTHKRVSDTYQIDALLLQEIITELGPEKQRYVEKVQDYLTKMGEKGNEVSRTLYGIDIFNEKVYFPLKSQADYRSSMEEALSQTQTQVSLKNTGMTKSTKPHANNPIVLQGFSEIVTEHIVKMAQYHAYVLPIENLQRVYNSSSKVTSGDTQKWVSTKAYIQSVFGEGGKNYLDQYITDLNGNINTGGAKNPLMKLFNTAKGVSVAANLSVVIQQPFAVIRAMDIINPKYFMSPTMAKNNTGLKKWDLIKKYSGAAVLKEIGGYDMGSTRQASDYIQNKKSLSDYTMIGAENADVLGWSIIWNAVEREVSAEGGYEVGTEAYYEACGKRFDEVVTKTQVYDSVNSRNAFMRSKHDTVKFITSFMGEPTTIVNMMYSRQLELYRAFKSGDKEKIKQAEKNIARTGAVIVASSVLTSMAKSLIYAMRDDDDDESYAEKWAKHFGNSLADDINPLNLVPLGRDIVSVWQGWSVERPDMTLVSDIIISFKKLIEEDASAEEWLNFAGAAANVFGVPLKNIYRDSAAIVNFFGDIFDGRETTDMGAAFEAGFSGNTEFTLKTRAEEAFKKGDTDGTESAVNDMVESKVRSGKTKKEAKSAVKQSFTSTYKSKYIKAYKNGDKEEVNDIRRFLYATGLWDTLSDLDKLLEKWKTE